MVSVGKSLPPVFACEATSAACHRVGRAQSPKVINKPSQFTVTEEQHINVNHRLGKSRAKESITHVMHIRKRMDMGMIVDLLPGRPKLLERIRAQCRENYYAPRPEYPVHLLQSDNRVAPGQHQISKNEIECCLGKRQSVGITDNRKPFFNRRLRAKRQRANVQPHNARLRKTSGERLRFNPCTTAQIQNNLWYEIQQAKALHQFLARSSCEDDILRIETPRTPRGSSD